MTGLHVVPHSYHVQNNNSYLFSMILVNIQINDLEPTKKNCDDKETNYSLCTYKFQQTLQNPNRLVLGCFKLVKCTEKQLHILLFL